MTTTQAARAVRRRAGRHTARRAARLLVALVTGAMVLSGCSIYDAPLPGGVSTGSNPMTIKVMFRDVLDLVPQSTVKIDDVTVGKVKKVALKGYVAEVTVEVPGNVKLPDNARAEIRQTSLLGEKFVQLEAPTQPGSGRLSNGDTIGLDRTGRNPEVEEVLGALSLLLNGGGVGQLKTIAAELNNTFGGRETEIRSVLDQIRSFMGQLDQNKQAIVAALENTSRLAVQLKKQDGTIKSALDNIPDTLRSVDRQRGDLVKLLASLNRLSGVGVRVIQASKASTINSLRSLAPVLDGFAKAGQNFPKSFEVFLTYPFVDEAIGRDPQVARNLHMGDFTNLSVNLDIDLLKLPLPGLPGLPPVVCDLAKKVDAEINSQLAKLPPLPPTVDKTTFVKKVAAAVKGVSCSSDGAAFAKAIGDAIAQELAKLPVALSALCPAGSTNPICKLAKNPVALKNLGQVTGGGTGGGLPGGVTLPRADLNQSYKSPQPLDPFGLAAHGLDPGVGTMLLQGVAEVR